MKILAGDIGGTRSRFSIATIAAGIHESVFVETLPSADYPSFDAALDDFLARAGRHGHGLNAIGLAVAGPIGEGRARITNLTWTIDGDALEARLDAGPVLLVNDFTAIGLGLESTTPEQLATLQEGEAEFEGMRAVIGAGTGLGQAIMSWNGRRYEVHATEGGHVDFAPRDEIEIALLKVLTAEFGRVSVERLVSGSGLARIFDFLCERSGHEPAKDLANALAEGDRAEAVSRFGMQDLDPVCVEALDRFISLYGAQAGNLALTCLPRGGLFVAGGIAPKILPVLTEGRFLESFLDKGRMRPLLERIPVHVVLDPGIGLRGAAWAAWRRAIA